MLAAIIVLAAVFALLYSFFKSLSLGDKMERLIIRVDRLEASVEQLRREAAREVSGRAAEQRRERESAPTPIGGATDAGNALSPNALVEIASALEPAAKETAGIHETIPEPPSWFAPESVDDPAPKAETVPEEPPLEPAAEASSLEAEAVAPAGEATRETIVEESPEAAGVAAAVSVGEQAAAVNADWETRIGKRWLTWGGVLLLVASAGFLIKYAYDQGWIGPWTQIGIGLAVGCGLCGLGDWQVRRRNLRAFGQGIMALGLSLVYLTCFGAFAYFKLAVASQTTTLVLLAITSLSGILLSNRHRSMPICILSAIGGYLAPILVSTGRPPPIDGLFTYTLIVNLSVIVVAMLRNWSALPLLAFAGTVTHFAGWYTKFYQPGDAATVAKWAAIFHFVFLLLPALPLVKGKRQEPWQWLLPAANAVLGVWVVWEHLADEHPLALLLVLLGMAAGHIAIGWWNRAAQDNRIARAVYSVIGLGVLTLAPLSWFGMEANLACWLLLGVLLLELGCRFDFTLYRMFGYGNLAIGILWAMALLWTRHNYHNPFLELLAFGVNDPSERYVESIGRDIFFSSLFSLDRFWTRLLVPAALAAAVAVLHRWRAKAAGGFVLQKTVLALVAAFLLFSFVGNDLNPWMYFRHAPASDYSRSWALVPLWCLGAVGAALAGRRWRLPAVSWIAWTYLIPAAFLAFHHLFFNRSYPDAYWFLNAGYLAKTVFAVSCMILAWTVGGGRQVLCAGVAGYLLVLTQHSETWSMLRYGEFWCWSLLWNATAVLYLLLSRKAGLRGLEPCFWLPYAVAFVFACVGMVDNIDDDATANAFRNPFYLAASLMALTLFLKAWLSGTNRLWQAIAAAWLLLLVNNAEVCNLYLRGSRMDDYNSVYAMLCFGALVWNVGALVFAGLQWRLGRLRLVAGMALPALMAGLHLCAAVVFRVRPEVQPLAAPFANLFYLNCALLCASLLLGSLESRWLRVWLGLLAGWLLLVATHLEIGYWHGPWSGFAARLPRIAWYTALWSAGTLAFLAVAVRYGRKRVYFASIRVLLVALFCAGWQYTVASGGYVLFLNARFLTSLFAVLSLCAVCRVAGRYALDVSAKGFIPLARRYLEYMYAFSAVAGFCLLTAESHAWCIARWGHTLTGRRIAMMSVSIAWAVYSISLLAAGFITRVRGWRLGGLVLFGVTCLKLVAVDLAHIEQIHRVLAFMAVGVLLMAASYLYHRLEKRIHEEEKGAGDAAEAP